MNESKLIPTSAIEESWKLGGRDYIPEFLSSVGIEPSATMPFGRGTMRLYPPSVLDLRQQFQTYLNERKTSIPLQPVTHNITAKNLRLEQRLASMEAKMDAIMKILEKFV
jgi:hypothetical protein